jgi:hypothetical protein
MQGTSVFQAISNFRYMPTPTSNPFSYIPV